jgi:hypothetical protein
MIRVMALHPGEQGEFLEPAGVRYRIFLRPWGGTYPNRYSPIRIDRVLEPRQGETIDLGEVRAEAAKLWGAVVRVLGPNNKPLEGILVRCWSLSDKGLRNILAFQTTDPDGLVQFYLATGTKGVFEIYAGRNESGGPAMSLESPYEIPANPTEIPAFTISLTREQLDVVLSGQASGAAQPKPAP